MRVSLSIAAATVSTAALLVVGLDYATFAVTGESLLLGRVNHADKTTTIVRQGAGVALSLESGHGSPSLRVSSSARVRRLDADLLDGKNASDLASHAVTYRAGKGGDVVTGLGAWRVHVRPGVYLVSFTAFVAPDNVAQGTTVGVICGVADLATLGPTTRVYTADSSLVSGDSGFPALMSGADTVRIGTGADPGIVCTTSTQGDFTLFHAVKASFTRVNSRVVKQATPVPTGPARPGRLFARPGR
jgi:hypothetical protein